MSEIDSLVLSFLGSTVETDVALHELSLSQCG